MTRNPPPRLRGFEYLGFYRYFLTICTFNRLHVFVNGESVRLAVMQLSRTANDREFDVIAYCFMPDHVHLLVQGSHPAANVREFVRTFKQRSSFEWKRTYILENPLRAGLVVQVEDYPYLGSMTLLVRGRSVR